MFLTKKYQAKDVIIIITVSVLKHDQDPLEAPAASTRPWHNSTSAKNITFFGVG